VNAPRHLTIGIDARAATEVAAGRGRVLRELLRELAQRPEDHAYRCYARVPWSEPLDERFRWEIVGDSDPMWNVHVARKATHQCDVFLSSNSYLTTWFLGVPGVPIVYDLVTFDRAMRPNRRSTLIERATLGLAVRRSAAFIAISQATADALAERYPSATTRTTVAPLGVANTLAGPVDPGELASLPSDEFVLTVGTLEPRKNLPRMIEAYRQLPDELKERHRLVVVGALGWQTGETLEALNSLGERVKQMGHVSDGALAELYRRCTLFCYPSLGEGFGLPVLEAMAAGAPVLTSNISSLPEVGGDAVAYADPHDISDIARQLEALLYDEGARADLAARGSVRATEFSWARFTQDVLHTLENVAP
jgi:glycosyltransferase involved in cell wall biosynthesis